MIFLFPGTSNSPTDIISDTDMWCWGGWAEQQGQLFRDCLQAHLVDAKRYTALKYALADRLH
jgi:GrpB-like predicted nucleotidyltransferase (UPF0157 family)